MYCMQYMPSGYTLVAPQVTIYNPRFITCTSVIPQQLASPGSRLFRASDPDMLSVKGAKAVGYIPSVVEHLRHSHPFLLCTGSLYCKIV